MSILIKISDVSESKDLRILVSYINKEADDSNESELNFNFEQLKSSYMKVIYIRIMKKN